MDIYKELKKLKRQIPRNTYKTIIGQLKAGNIEGATKGLITIKRRLDKA